MTADQLAALGFFIVLPLCVTAAAIATAYFEHRSARNDDA